MTDISARLRNLGWETCHEGADEIERLKRENQWLYDQIAAQKRTAGSSGRPGAEAMSDLDDPDHWTALVAELEAEIERLTADLKQAESNGIEFELQRDKALADNERLRALSQNNALSWDTIVHERDALRAALDRAADALEFYDNKAEAQKARAALEPKP